MVPDSECRMPTLIGDFFAAMAGNGRLLAAAAAIVAPTVLIAERRSIEISS
nr:hypothetical protein [Thiomonas sp.]